MIVRQEPNGVLLSSVSAEEEGPRRIDLTGIAGSMPWLRPLTREEREFEDSPRIWDQPGFPQFPRRTGVKYLLDANSLISLLAGTSSSLIERAASCGEEDLATSAIAFAEVALGSWNGQRPSLVVLDRVSTRIPVLPFDELAAKMYAQLPFRRGSFDRLIAAHAVALNIILVTANERDFADVPRLKVENWTR